MGLFGAAVLAPNIRVRVRFRVRVRVRVRARVRARVRVRVIVWVQPFYVKINFTLIGPKIFGESGIFVPSAILRRGAIFPFFFCFYVKHLLLVLCKPLLER